MLAGRVLAAAVVKLQCQVGKIDAVTQDRTGDLQIFSLTLSQLSYRGIGSRAGSSCAAIAMQLAGEGLGACRALRVWCGNKDTEMQMRVRT